MGALAGKKTYIVAAVMVIVGGLYQQGYVNESTYLLLSNLLMAGGLAALRAGVSKNGK